MSDNPYENSTTPGDAAGLAARTGFSMIVKIAAVVGILILLFLLLIPTRRTASEPARRNGCMNNLRQIALALLSYESANGTLPPAFTVDSDGNRLHSWRALILPYMEEQQLYDSIDFSKPWDDPVNEAARETQIGLFMCPSAPHEDRLTTYLAVTHDGCTFDGATARELSDISDKYSQTMILIDIEPELAVHWMSPFDADVEAAMRFDTETDMNHGNVFLAAFVDGSVKTLPLDLSAADRKALMTIAGDDKPTSEEFSR